LQAILADSVPPEKRGMGYAATNVVPNIPTIIAPATAGFLVSTYGLVPGMRIVYSLVFACVMIAAIIRLLFLRETLHEPQKIPLGAMKKAFRDSLGAIAEAWRDMSTSLKFLTVAILISAFEEPVFRMFTSLYVLDVIRVSEMEWGIVNTIWILVTLSLGFPLGKCIDKIGRKKSIMLAYLLFTPSSIAFIFCRSFPLLLVIYLMFAAGGNLMMPAYNALQADMIPREKRGRIMGTIGTLNVLATVPASALSGFLYDSNPAYPFVFSVVLGITVALLILFAVKEPEKREI
jgi:MFS family permease